jgi:uncharacterized caspase-like protein
MRMMLIQIRAQPLLFSIFLMVAAVLGSRASHSAEIRFALVIGNDTYKAVTLPTPANDAGLTANTLQSAGFTVSGARNLDQDTLRRSFREFLDQVAGAGPDAVALVYLSGLAVQFEGENYFIPVDADVKRDVDIPIQAIRISDFIRPLAALPGRVKIVILDAARQNPFAMSGPPLASGLALLDPDPSTAVAFNAAPGTIAPNETGPYGAFATALSEMIHAGGLGLDDVFARVRLRVDELTQGAEVPWYASQIQGPFEFTVRAAGAPPLPKAVAFAEVRRKPMRSYTVVDEAYAAALERDSLEGYEEFLGAFPDSRFARRIELMLAARREAIIWRRCVMANSPHAYWSYLRRYPDGPHAFDARRRLHEFSAALEPPMGFAPVEFGVPPPPPKELGYFKHRVIIFNDPGFGPPPRPPERFLPPRPHEFAVLPPPQRPREAFVLPTTAATALPIHARPPASVAPSPAHAGRPVTPGARPSIPVSLPAAVHAKINPAAPGATPRGPASAPAHLPPGAVRPATLPPGAAPRVPTAAAKPAPLPTPAEPTAPTAAKPAPTPRIAPSTAPASVKPAPVRTPPPTAPAAIKPRPLPPHAPPTAPVAVKPAPSPPHPAPLAPTAVKPATPSPRPAPLSPTAVKPAPPPSRPLPPAPAAVKPAAPPPRPAPPAPAVAKPAPPAKPPAKIVCPAGKSAAVVNGREICK